MASIYDIAKIASGDPLGAAADAAKEADIIFQQYQNQKERVEEINKAIAEAKRKQKKNKFGYNLLGSALGGLGGLLFPTAGPVIQGLLAGLGSGVAEKYRQDRTDSTKTLRELRSKYKNRAISDDITEAIDAFEMEKDAMLQTDTIANALTGAMLPVESLGIKPDKEMIKAITGIDEETLNKFDFLDEDIVAGLIRALGPQAYSAFTTPKITVDPLYQPQFRNPFGGF